MERCGRFITLVVFSEKYSVANLDVGRYCTVSLIRILFNHRFRMRIVLCSSKDPATRNDIVDPSSTMVFNVAKIASARASSTISLTKSLRVAGPLLRRVSSISHHSSVVVSFEVLFRTTHDTVSILLTDAA